MMSDEENMNPFEILKISQAKGEECMKAILGVIGESRNGHEYDSHEYCGHV
jgi:hypothetical protein